MKVETQTVQIPGKEVLLKLTPSEARWLQGVMQNPLHGQSPVEEDSADQQIRHELFLALKKVIDDLNGS